MKKNSGFTLIEILVAAAVFSIFSAALLTSWSALQTSALNTTNYAQRQNDQMRVIDYIKRDIRRATTVDVYNGGTLVTGTTFGNELRLTIPDYYTDSREEDDSIGSNTAATPALSGTTVSYGTALSVRYYVSNGAVIRYESGTTRALTNGAGAFTVSFSKDASGLIRARLLFNQQMRSGSNRILNRQVDVLCGQRTQLQS
jgi:prepilin-type N-terminal cleavage/methylation domain-containing protein